MTRLADQLPPEIASRIHPDRRKNEAEYWAARDQLLLQYRDQWVGFADGRVIASGRSPVSVLHEAEATGLHPFVICVGQEAQPSRVRRVEFPYDADYHNESLPMIGVEFRAESGEPGVKLDRVIPDTGADATVLPWADCEKLGLEPEMGVQSLISGVTGGSAATLAFQIWAYLDGAEYLCRLQADFSGSERILGRDVLNRMEVLFRGPAAEVVINP